MVCVRPRLCSLKAYGPLAAPPKLYASQNYKHCIHGLPLNSYAHLAKACKFTLLWTLQCLVPPAAPQNRNSSETQKHRRRRPKAPLDRRGPLDSLQTLFGPPPKRRSTGRRRSRSGTPRQPPKPAVTVSPSDESVDSRDGRPPVVDARYPAPTPPWEYEVDGDTDIMLADGRIISTADPRTTPSLPPPPRPALSWTTPRPTPSSDDAASVDTSVCSERQTEWVWRSGLDVSECVDDWGWEDALAERKQRLLAEFVGDDRRPRGKHTSTGGTSASTGK